MPISLGFLFAASSTLNFKVAGGGFQDNIDLLFLPAAHDINFPINYNIVEGDIVFSFVFFFFSS